MKYIIFSTCFLLISCSSSQSNYVNASGCFAEYSQNGKTKSFPIAKIAVKDDAKIVFIENNGTSTSIANSTIFDINNPTKIICSNKEKSEKLNRLFQ